MTKHEKLPTDLVDDLRTQVNKIGKLAPDLDAWQHAYAVSVSEAEKNNTNLRASTTEEQAHAALAIMAAIEQMRGCLRSLKGAALDVAETKIESDKWAQDSFLSRDEL